MTSDEEYVAFWSLAYSATQKTVLCTPEHEAKILAEVEIRGLEDLIIVVANPWVPKDKVYVFDAGLLDTDLMGDLARIRPKISELRYNPDRCQSLLITAPHLTRDPDNVPPPPEGYGTWSEYWAAKFTTIANP